MDFNGNTAYKFRPVGNRPKFMPLDNSLNNNIQQSLSLHCAIMAHFVDTDEQKFSLKIQITIVDVIQRLYNSPGGNAPFSERII